MYFQAPFLVLQIVTNRELCSVPGRTRWKDHDGHIRVPVGYTLRKKVLPSTFRLSEQGPKSEELKSVVRRTEVRRTEVGSPKHRSAKGRSRSPEAPKCEEPKYVPWRTEVGPPKDRSRSPKGPKSVPRRTEVGPPKDQSRSPRGTKVGYPEGPKSVPWRTEVGPEARSEARTPVRPKSGPKSPNGSKEPKYPFGHSKYWTEFFICDNLKHPKKVLGSTFFRVYLLLTKPIHIPTKPANPSNYPQGHPSTYTSTKMSTDEFIHATLKLWQWPGMQRLYYPRFMSLHWEVTS